MSMRDVSASAATTTDVGTEGRVTRRRLIYGALGGAAATGAATVGVARGQQKNPTKPSPDLDSKILGFFLRLEQIQETFYGAAVDSGQLHGELLKYATAVHEQEARHAAFLADRLGRHADSGPPVRLDHA